MVGRLRGQVLRPVRNRPTGDRQRVPFRRDLRSRGPKGSSLRPRRGRQDAAGRTRRCRSCILISARDRWSSSPVVVGAMVGQWRAHAYLGMASHRSRGVNLSGQPEFQIATSVAIGPADVTFSACRAMPAAAFLWPVGELTHQDDSKSDQNDDGQPSGNHPPNAVTPPEHATLQYGPMALNHC